MTRNVQTMIPTLKTTLSAAACLLSLALSAQASSDSGEAITQYTQEVWRTNDGLPQNSVLAIAQTPDGYLWLGTEEGLARFDGVRFVNFNTDNTPALRSNHISALLVDREKNLWIGTQGGGVTLLRNGIFTTYSTRDGLSNDGVLALYRDGTGSLWIGTDGGGLNRFRDGRFKTYTLKDGLPDQAVFSLDGDRAGNLWIGTHAGLARLQNGRFTTYTTKDGLAANYVKCLRVDRADDVWVGTNGGGLSRLSRGRFTNYKTRDGISSDSVGSIMEDTTGSLWVGTYDGGVSRFQNGKFATYAVKDGLPSNRVFALFQGREGGLWIGTGGSGLVRLRRGGFESITAREGLSNDVVLPVYEDYAGAIWAGTNGGGLNRIEGGQVTRYTTRNGLSNNVVFSIAGDKEHNLWIATRDGLNKFKNGRFTVFNQRNGLPKDIILCLYSDHEGNLWAGSRGGLIRFDGVKFSTYTTKDGLSSNYVASLFQDRQGTLWIGTGGGGLNNLRDGHFTSYSTKDGLSNNSVWSITGDADGVLWVGTEGGGLNRLKNGNFTAYTVHQGLFDDELFQVLSDEHGYLWIGSNKGVFKVLKSQLNAYAEGRLTAITSVPYGTADGLKSNECNGGFQPAGWRMKDGRLLFPTMKGLAMVDPGKLERDRPAPPVLIESVSIDGANLDARHAVEATPGEGKLEISFTAPSLVSSDKILFKYKLEGFDKGWIEAGRRRTAYYTNIPPGKYRFAVLARHPASDWSREDVSVGLTLLPHFYQTSWFAVCCASLAAGLCAGIYLWRIRHLKVNEKRLLQLVHERTQALQEQVDAKELARAELAEAQQSLVELSRRSGMAEVATGVIHNVGNVLNSVNVGAAVISSKVRDFRTEKLSVAVGMLQENVQDLAGFVEKDPKGQRVLPYLAKLAQHLHSERAQVLSELESLTGHIDHIKQIVATQQDYAKASTLTEAVYLPAIVDEALKLEEASLHRHNVEIVREIQEVPEVVLAKHKVVEILVNLIRNAKQAVQQQNGPVRQVRICVKNQSPHRIRVEVHDTGVGVAAENLTRIFAHGFTTKVHGHGFGLHSGALAAKQMGGSLWADSKGPGLGATFVLELPTDAHATRPE